MERKGERSRVANFSKAEETLLLRIVSNHISIIDIKKTDSVTNSMKTQKWLEIQEEFNSQNFGDTRDAGALRRKYENLKKGFKKMMNDTMTGSGSKDVFTDEQTQLLQAMIRPRAVKFQNTSDDDVSDDNRLTESSFMETDENKYNSSNDVGIEPFIVVKTEDEINDANESSEMPSSTTSMVFPQSSASTSNIGSHSEEQTMEQPVVVTPHEYQCLNITQPFSLAQSTHRAFRTRKRGPASASKLGKMSGWATFKADIAQQEQNFKIELHEQKKRHLEEEHELRKQLLEQQIRHAEERQSWLREEHQEKMKKKSN